MRTKMKMNVTVAEMEAEGWEVTVKHLRRMFNFPNLVDNTALRHLQDKTQINPKGGLTFVLLEKEVDGGSIRLCGEARCSEHDNYNKRTGLSIALGRAISGTKLKLTGKHDY